MIKIFSVVISSICLIYIITDDYLTYRRLNKLTDKLIGDKEMSSEDKLKNLCWMRKNCNYFSSQSLVCSRKCDAIVTKIESYLAEVDE